MSPIIFILTFNPLLKLAGDLNKGHGFLFQLSIPNSSNLPPVGTYIYIKWLEPGDELPGWYRAQVCEYNLDGSCKVIHDDSCYAWRSWMATLLQTSLFITQQISVKEKSVLIIEVVCMVFSDCETTPSATILFACYLYSLTEKCWRFIIVLASIYHVQFTWHAVTTYTVVVAKAFHQALRQPHSSWMNANTEEFNGCLIDVS